MSKFRKQHMSIDWYDMIDTAEDTAAVPASKATLKEKSTLVGRIGSMLLSSGTAAWRVRASMNKLSRALGIVCNADIGLLTIEYTCIEGSEEVTTEITLSTAGVSTDRINAIEQFSDNFAERVDKYSVEQFHHILDKIGESAVKYKAWQLGLASGIACCSFAFLLGGGPMEMIGAFFGAGVGQFIRKKLIEHHITLTANVCASVTAACAVYVLVTELLDMLVGLPAVHQAGYICAMLFIIPGFPLITGGFDIAKLDLRSGMERITYALLIICTATITGYVAAFVFRYAPGDLPEPVIPMQIKTAMRLVASFAGVFGFSLMLGSNRKMAFTASMIGMLCNTFRLTLVDLTGIPVGIGAFIGAMCAGLAASGIKRFVGFPRITITVPSIVIMVPGMFMYKAIYYFALNNTSDGLLWITKAFMIVLALPMGLIAARILTDNNFRKNS